MSTSDPFNLERFVAAQERTLHVALEELSAGRKRTHWIWFVFPQLRGLGFSDLSYRYGIVSLLEARAYIAHPLLGPRLEAATRQVMKHSGTPLREILGSPDDLKFRSSMTLFAAAAGPDSIFASALAACCGGKECARTARTAGCASRRGARVNGQNCPGHPTGRLAPLLSGLCPQAKQD